MNILIISFSVNGAMGDNFKQVTRYLTNSNNVHVLTNIGISATDLGTNNICNVGFNRKNITNFINPISYHKIYQYVKNTQFDVAFILSPHPLNIYIYHIIDNSKIVTYVHDHVPHSGVKGLDALFLNIQLKYFYRRSKKIIVSCNWIKHDILSKHFIKKENLIDVNYLGLLENHLYPNDSIKEDIDVLFFGRIEYYKGLDTLIESAKQLDKYKFYIIGKGDIKETFKIKEIPVNCSHVNYYISDKDLAEYIQRSKLIVLPYRDATGTQTIQSIFYYKKPIIATNVGCFPEYITDQHDGMIIPTESPNALANAIRILLEDENKRKEMGLNGYSKISTIFNNQTITERYIQIFKSL